MLKTKVMSIKQTILEIQRQSDLPEVSCILENNVNTLPEMNNNSPEELAPILRYDHAQNQGYVKKTDKSRN